MRHAQRDFAHAQMTAALDDLLERRDHRFRAFEAETFRAGVFQVAEFLEGLGFDELAQNRLAALGREADVLFRPFDALLNPAFLRRIRDVHELEADLAAIRAAQDRQDLSHGRRFEAHDVIDENRPVEIGFGEAVGFRQQFAMDAAIGNAERIEVGGKVADDAISADQHQGADRILRRAKRSGGRDLEARQLRTPFDLIANSALGCSVVARQRADEIAIGAGIVQQRFERRRPGGAIGNGWPCGRLLDAVEKQSPFVADGARVALVLGLHVFDVGCIRSAQERGAEKRFVLAIS